MILCCGEALIDMIPAVSETGTNAFAPHSGGSVFNTAIALGRLGASTGFLSGLSSDPFGDQLRRSLNDSNVDTSMVIMSDRPTTLAFVRVTDGQANYTFYDENTAGQWLHADRLPEVPDTVTALYFGGISLIGEPCADFYAALAVRESASKIIAIDPNIRASLIKNEEQYRGRLDRIIRHADIVKVSDEDLNWIVQEPSDLIEKARAIQDMGPKLVILTKGSKGACALTPDGKAVEVSAQQVEVVDTVGAGDTFNAGVLAKLAEKHLLTKESFERISAQEIRDAVQFGALVAAKTVSRSGADSPWANELEVDHQHI